ncbi:MAG: single-stranded DNA-binding protein [Acidobacteria bacterium]|nr:single-stranded DNA-binding protein [Acidobacteriota bacterium]MXZ72776.1 single-stranded DNA-binding protein [Acidobacteriota bacterium]MYD69889.1 single-stranded DNA-binding protein [Acidobacteriota bacterium]MYJ03765.1 single-stranded DNA-binding protein [Acidobacteriota bacterium]
MASLCKVSIVGNLGRDAEQRYTPGGDAVVTFSVATTEVRNNRGEREEHTQWFRVDFWGKRGERIKDYLTKGQRVFVDGRLRVRDYEDRDGKARYSLDVRADDVVLLGSRRDGEGRQDRYDDQAPAAAADAASVGGSGGNVNLADDDIPF